MTNESLAAQALPRKTHRALKKLVPLLAVSVLALAMPLGWSAPAPTEELGLLPENAQDCGIPTRDVSGYDLVSVHETGRHNPDTPSDLNVLALSIAEWRCVYPAEQMGPDSDLFPYRGGFTDAHPTPDPSHHASGGIGTLDIGHSDPTTYYSSGYMKVYILLPNQGDPLYPGDGCNWDNVGQAMNQITGEIGGGATYERWCYYLPNWNTGGTTNVGTLLNQLHEAVWSSYSWMFDERNEIIHGYVEEADHNGAAWQYDRFSFTANHRVGGADAWEDSVTMHEIGHTINAVHYPDEDRKENCLYSYSVMNYCGLGVHALDFDSGNLDRARTAWRAS